MTSVQFYNKFWWKIETGWVDFFSQPNGTVGLRITKETHYKFWFNRIDEIYVEMSRRDVQALMGELT